MNFATGRSGGAWEVSPHIETDASTRLAQSSTSSGIRMLRLRPVLISNLALSFLVCATTPAPPDADPGSVRLSPEELARMMLKPDPKLSLAKIVRASGAQVD